MKKNIEEMTLLELYEEKKKLLTRLVGTTYSVERIREIDKQILVLKNSNNFYENNSYQR